jgi:AcrR family transcriptional regulator
MTEENGNILTRAKRGAMVDLAIEVIADGGLGALTFRRLATDAGTSTAPFTTEFGTREEMLKAVMKAVWRRIGIQPSEFEAEDPMESLRVVLRRATPVDEPVSPLLKAWLELYVAAVDDAPLKEALTEVEAEGYPDYVGLIEKCQAAGEISKDHDPEELLSALWALGDGLLLGYLLYPDFFTGERTDRIWEQGYRSLIADPV